MKTFLWEFGFVSVGFEYLLVTECLTRCQRKGMPSTQKSREIPVWALHLAHAESDILTERYLFERRKSWLLSIILCDFSASVSPTALLKKGLRFSQESLRIAGNNCGGK